jgi:hypothetical protein
MILPSGGRGRGFDSLLAPFFVEAQRKEFGWPSGLRRWFKAPVSSGAWVRIPLRTPFWRKAQMVKGRDSGGQQVGGETPWDQTRNSRRQAASGGLRGAWLCEGGRAGGIELVGGGWV